MEQTTSEREPRVRRAVTGKVLVVLAAAAIVGVAACGSSSGTKASGTTAAPGATTPTTAAASATTVAAGATTTEEAAASGDKPVTLSIKAVPGVGPVLVNEDGDTLYLLSSEKGGKITCTDANGCTTPWPDTELPKGDTAGKATGGANPALLGTIKSDDGDVYVTYGGWPLYTFAGDGGPGKANGQGIKSFGGTWYVINAAGDPVTAGTATGNSATTTTSGY